MLGYAEHAKTRAIATPSYHQVVQPIYRRSVSRWRNYRPFVSTTFCRCLRPFIEAFGYATAETRPPEARQSTDGGETGMRRLGNSRLRRHASMPPSA